MRLDLKDIDISPLFLSKTVTVTLTMPINVVYLMDQEALASVSTRSRVAAGLMDRGLRALKIQQLQEHTRVQEETDRKKARRKG